MTPASVSSAVCCVVLRLTPKATAVAIAACTNASHQAPGIAGVRWSNACSGSVDVGGTARRESRLSSGFIGVLRREQVGGFADRPLDRLERAGEVVDGEQHERDRGAAANDATLAVRLQLDDVPHGCCQRMRAKPTTSESSRRFWRSWPPS